MKNFYLSSALAQTILLVALFLTLILSLFLQLTAYGRQRDKWKRYLHLSVFLFLLILLSVLADASSQINEGSQYKTWLPLPMWLLWCITFAADFLMIWDIAGLCRLRRQALGRDSIKQALDMLAVYAISHRPVALSCATGKWILYSIRFHRVIFKLLQNCRMHCQTVMRAGNHAREDGRRGRCRQL